MLSEHCITVGLLCLLTLLDITQCQIVDVARGKPISANYTCGAFGEEYYYEHSLEHATGQERENNKKICSNMTQHPPSAMVDGDTATFWQSTSRLNLITSGGFATSESVKDIEILIDLQTVRNSYLTTCIVHILHTQSHTQCELE